MRYQRHLPHWQPEKAIFHVSWRLAGSLPSKDPEVLFRNSVRTGPQGLMWLADLQVAQIVVDALHYGEKQKSYYELFAYVVMPNHVHIMIEPFIELPFIMRWLKGRTARIANRILGRTNQPFWHEESYDHIIRSADEFRKTAIYIEQNPVRAGYVESSGDWRWSIALTDDEKRSSVVQV